MNSKFRISIAFSAALGIGAFFAAGENAKANCESSYQTWPTGSYKQVALTCSSPNIKVVGQAGNDSGGKYVYVGCTAGTCNSSQYGATSGFNSGGSYVCGVETSSTGGSNSSYSGCSTATKFKVYALYGI